MCHSKEKLWELPPGPRVVLASVPSLAAGMSLQLLVDWAPNPNNLIIFPGTAQVRRLCLPRNGQAHSLCLAPHDLAARRQDRACQEAGGGG